MIKCRKKALSESPAEAEEWTNDNVRFQALRLVGSSASASDSDNLDHKLRSRKRNRKKWKRSDSSDSDSVELIAYGSAYDSDFRFSLINKVSYDSDSVASENQP